MKVIGALLILVLFVLTAATGPTAIAASGNTITGAPNALDHVPPRANSIPPGTIITTQNWQNYRQFMPDGMAAMFEGKYFWRRTRNTPAWSKSLSCRTAASPCRAIAAEYLFPILRSRTRDGRS